MNFKPEGYTTLTPYLTMRDAAGAIDFYKKVFGAKERMRMNGPDGKIGHAELEFGDAVIMLADECSEGKSPQTLGGSPVGMMMYVADVDAVVKTAVAEGATLQRSSAEEVPAERPERGPRARVRQSGDRKSLGSLEGADRLDGPGARDRVDRAAVEALRAQRHLQPGDLRVAAARGERGRDRGHGHGDNGSDNEDAGAHGVPDYAPPAANPPG